MRRFGERTTLPASPMTRLVERVTHSSETSRHSPLTMLGRARCRPARVPRWVQLGGRTAHSGPAARRTGTTRPHTKAGCRTLAPPHYHIQVVWDGGPSCHRGVRAPREHHRSSRRPAVGLGAGLGGERGNHQCHRPSRRGVTRCSARFRCSGIPILAGVHCVSSAAPSTWQIAWS